MMEERPDSGIVVDYFDSSLHSPLLDYPNEPFYYDCCPKATQVNDGRSASLIDLMNYIDPASKMSDKEVIMKLIDCYLCVDTELFERFRSCNVTLNNLTRSCSLEVMSKFEVIGSKISNLIGGINDQLDGEDGEVQHITFYTYLTTLRKLLNRDVQRVILRIDEQIRQESIQFRSLWEFLQYLNGQQCGHLVDKVNLLSSINLNIDLSAISQQLSGQPNHPPDRSLQNYHKLVSILDNLYLNLKFPTDENRFLWILFLNCFKPALKYLQGFLINGYQTDPNDEFFFESVDYRYEADFWSTCLVMRGGGQPAAAGDQSLSVPICLKKCWDKLVNGLKSRLLMRYAEQAFNFKSFHLYDEFVDDLFLSLGFMKRGDDARLVDRSPEPLTSNAFSYDYLNQVNDEVSKLFSSVESIDRTSNHTLSSTSLNSLSDDPVEKEPVCNLVNVKSTNTLETIMRKHITTVDEQIENYGSLNEHLIELNRRYELKELNLHRDADGHELDGYVLREDQSRTKQIKIYFCESLERSLNKLIQPISSQVSQLFKQDFLDYLRFFNDYYLMQLEQHSFSLFFHTLFEKLIHDPIGFQDNLYSKFYDLRDFGFESTNLILFLRFSETFKDELIYFDIISRLNFVYNDLDWTSSTVINNGAQDFYNRSCKVLMKIKFIKWLTNNLPSLNRDFNVQRQRKLPFYRLIHKLFLIKHSLSIVVDALHSSLLIKIHSLQPDLYAEASNASNFPELVDVFEAYLQQVASILHLDVSEANELDEESSPFHGFIRKLCEKAIDIWKIWFAIEELFYANFDENNSHRQLEKFVASDKAGRRDDKLSAKISNKATGKLAIKPVNGKPATTGKLLNVGALANGRRPTDKVGEKAANDKRSSKVNGKPEDAVRNDSGHCPRTGTPTQPAKPDRKRDQLKSVPKHFDISMDVNEMGVKLDEINEFLMANAKIFQV